MSGVDINSLSTKFDVLERVSPKSRPVASSKSKDNEATLSTDKVKPSTSKSVDAEPMTVEEDSFSKELQAQESKVAYSKPTDTRPAGVQVPIAKNPEVESLEVSPFVATKKKAAIVPNQDLQLLGESKQPILKFLDSMERELGIEPQEILGAFSTMSSEALLLPPEQSTEEFLQALELQPTQAPRARTLYSELLEGMSRNELEMQAKEKGDGFIHLKANEWDLIPDKQALPRNFKIQQNQLQSKQVEDLSNRFFNVQSAKPNAEYSMFDIENTLSSDPNLFADTSLYAEVEVPVNYEAPDFDVNKIQLSQKPELQNIQWTMGEGSEFDLDSNVNQEQKELSVDVDTTEVDGQFGLQPNQPSTKLQSMDAVATTPVVQLKDPVKPEEIVQKAELLVKKGGGEVKMKLNPEGLGEVHLKVVLQEGKVDVQLITESQHAKKAIESELQNLKAVLADNKMDLRDIKVDVSQNLSRQMQEQLADQQREHARQFLNYFRENFGSGRNAMAYSGGIAKTYNGQNPEDVVQTSSQQRRYNREPGRLSVVA